MNKCSLNFNGKVLFDVKNSETVSQCHGSHLQVSGVII